MGNFVERHAHALATLHHVEVLVCIPDSTRSKPEVETTQNGALIEHRVYYPGAGMRAAYRAFRKGVNTVVSKREKEFDLVHHNVLHTAGWQARWLKKKFGLPYVVTEHWNGFHNGWFKALSWRRRWLVLAAARGATQLCPVSHHLGKAMHAAGIHGAYHVVPNVVDTDLFAQGVRPERLSLVHVSHLGDDHKNISGMLRVVKRLCDAGQDLTLAIIGDGDIRPHQTYAAELGITDVLSFQTEQPIEGIAAAMQKASALLLFSNYENLPCVIVEAFSVGIPVVATDVGGIAEHVPASHGVLVPKADEDALFEALRHFDPSNYPADELRAYAVRHFSEHAVAEAYTHVYKVVAK